MSELIVQRYFIDTNIFLRYLTNDDPVKTGRIENLFKQAERKMFTLTTSHLVIAELVWTLESYYRLQPLFIEETILKIINTPFIELPNEDLILQALDLYVIKNIDFIDAYNAIFMRESGITQIYTYDTKHFKRIEWVEVFQP
jgi:predicted nucleic-acid-binding protein